MSQDIVNSCFRDETRRYVEQINKSTLHVKVDSVCFGNFIYREEHKLLQLRMIDGDA